MKTKQGLVNAFAELILSNIGTVGLDGDAVADCNVLKKTEYSKDQSITELLVLKQGGFADSVEIKKTTEQDAKVYFFDNNDDLQTVIQLTSTEAKDVEGWRPLKNNEPLTAMFEDMEKSARASVSNYSENCLTERAGMPESAVGLAM